MEGTGHLRALGLSRAYRVPFFLHGGVSLPRTPRGGRGSAIRKNLYRGGGVTRIKRPRGPLPARALNSQSPERPSSELTRGHRRLSRRRRTRPGSCQRRPRSFGTWRPGCCRSLSSRRRSTHDAEDDAEDDQGALPKATAGGRADLRPDSSGASGADRRRIPFLPGPNQVPYRPVSFQSIFIQSGYCRGGGGGGLPAPLGRSDP